MKTYVVKYVGYAEVEADNLFRAKMLFKKDPETTLIDVVEAVP